jgi:hypothetical protein
MTHEEISGLMLGNAGIGHVYLRLSDPSLGSLLAPSPMLETHHASGAIAVPA